MTTTMAYRPYGARFAILCCIVLTLLAGCSNQKQADEAAADAAAASTEAAAAATDAAASGDAAAADAAQAAADTAAQAADAAAKSADATAAIAAPDANSVAGEQVDLIAIQREKAQQAAQIDTEVDQALQAMRDGSVAFNHPTKIMKGESTTITLLLHPKLTPAQLESQLHTADNTQGHTIRFSNRMKAVLKSEGFEIEPLSEEVQAISETQGGEWKWLATARDAGDQVIYLSVAALIDVDGEITPRQLKTYTASIPVRVQWHKEVAAFCGNNWQWIWAALLVPVGTIFWRRAKGKKQQRGIGSGST